MLTWIFLSCIISLQYLYLHWNNEAIIGIINILLMLISITFMHTQLFHIRTFFISFWFEGLVTSSFNLLNLQCHAPGAHQGMGEEEGGLRGGVFSFDLVFLFFSWGGAGHVQSVYATPSLMTIMDWVKRSKVYFWWLYKIWILVK